MGIFGRLEGVIKSNLNALVDPAKDPEKLIGQTIIDMERELKAARQDMIRAAGSEKRYEAKRKEALAEAESWEQKAILALREDDDELAREALKRKLKATRDAEVHAREAGELAAQVARMRGDIEGYEAKLAEIKARRGTLAAEVKRARGAGGNPFEGGALSDLERMVGRVEQMEAEVEAHAILEDPGRADVDARFRALEARSADDGISDELASLKEQLGD